ncbi:hybrid sensor histidine kinase/response regulator [Chitinophaga solisilvae]|uniref:histidine kinase n=1 Tax=Chitinophaga solisilvae TaxID=1233460 RepID=A0A3S1AWB6_9BACT|nr:hybrid sensor histidine kinase/response regulator [Chitinophaga solisilvae]NSL86135.1 response regulator [Chitinophaga solisilvae]
MKETIVFFTSLIHSGTSNFYPKEDNYRIQKVNITALLLISLSLGFGIVYYVMSWMLILLVSALVHAALFSLILLLNKKKKHTAAGVTLQTMINCSTVYYGFILAKAVDPLWLTLFLLISCLSFIKVGRAQIMCMILSALSLVLLEVNRIYPVVPALDFTESMTQLIHYCTAFTVVILTSISLVSIVYYNAKLFRTIKMRNDQLVRLNKELHISNSRLEDQVKERTANLQNAVIAKNIFVRELTHELRTPLNAIYSIAQLKLLAKTKNSIEKKIDEDLFIACRNLQSLINNTQDKCKLDTGNFDEVKKESILTYSWINNIVNIYQYFANERRVKIQLEIEQDFPMAILEDSIKLTKIVNNILVNAIKFTRANTVIHTRIYRNNGSQWCIAVRDQGEGIPADKISTIFKEFTRTTINFAEGSGLGLNITHQLVKILCGTIEVYSQEGEGTEFVVSLPLVEYKGQIQSTSVQLKDNTLISFEGKKVLLVDDDDMTKRYLSLLLSKRGFSIMHAENGHEALIKAQDRPDIIILDMSLPGKSGQDVLQELKASPTLKDIPVIVASADTDETNMEEIMLDGACSYMVKPIDFPILIDIMVKNLLTGVIVRN